MPPYSISFLILQSSRFTQAPSDYNIILPFVYVIERGDKILI